MGPHKVAIPRLQRDPHWKPYSPDCRTRTKTACNSCRRYKIRCSGGLPRCRQCDAHERDCVYAVTRTDRVSILEQRCSQMVDLLRALKICSGDERERRIDSLLADIEVVDSESTGVCAISLANASESKPAISEGFNQPLDMLGIPSFNIVEEGLPANNHSQANQTPKAQWYRDIEVPTKRTGESPSEFPFRTTPQRRRNSHTSDGTSTDTYHGVNIYETLPLQISQSLLNCYTNTVHQSFPIVSDKLLHSFREHFKKTKDGSSLHLSPELQAILNFILAISAKCPYLKADLPVEQQKRILQQSHTKALSLGSNMLVDYLDVPQIQVTGLMSFYYFTAGELDRSWIILGNALRSAVALGLHVRSEAQEAPRLQRERSIRVWWSLHSLEQFLCTLVGRPGYVVDTHCSVPLPIPLLELDLDDIDESIHPDGARPKVPPFSPLTNASSSAVLCTVKTVETANSGSFFKAFVQLGIITQTIQAFLYSPGAAVRSANDIQQDVLRTDQQLEAWVRALPTGFDFRHTTTRTHRHERLILGMFFRKAKILLNLPGLLPYTANWNIPKTCADVMAKNCIAAAKDTIDCIPIPPCSNSAEEFGLWWCAPHLIPSAISVFLLALLHLTLASQDIRNLLQYVSKSFFWSGQTEDASGMRAYHTAVVALELVAARLSLNLPSYGIHLPSYMTPEFRLKNAQSSFLRDPIAFVVASITT